MILLPQASREKIQELVEHMADAQLDEYLHRGHFPADWLAASFYVGLIRLAGVSPFARFACAAREIAEKNNWQFHTSGIQGDADYIDHADNLCIGQLYIDCAKRIKTPEKLVPMRKQTNEIVARFDHPTKENLARWNNRPERDGKTLPWWWCDALFMAPPTLAGLSGITGDPQYIQAADRQWWITVEHLYSHDDHLFFRDNQYRSRRAPSGQRVFWSRGNGWVMAGLANYLSLMPADFPTRKRHETLFVEMCRRLAELQQPDGLWRSNLVDAEACPWPETSGTAFFCYAIAWGINHGLLARKTYGPHVERAWLGLCEAIRPDGLLGWTQGIGESPDRTTAQSTQPFSVGGFLLAGCELLASFPSRATEKNEVRRCATRYVPERCDDFYWENDRIGFRVYGPALNYDPKGPPMVSSGIDVWVKSVRYPFMDNAYLINDYHNDHGEGMDCYDTGTSRGCGGLGIWDDAAEKLYCSGNWIDASVLQHGPDVASFRVLYAPWNVGGDRQVRETRTFSLAAGSNLTRMVSRLESDQEGELLVGIGLNRRTADGRRFRGDGHLLAIQDKGLLAYWEPEQIGKGTIGVAVIVDPARIVKFTSDERQHLAIVRVKPGAAFVYYAGACWDRGLDFRTWEDWKGYLLGFQPDFDPHADR